MVKYGKTVSSMVLVMLVALSVGASAQTATKVFDPLRGLKKALADANALALSTTQETQINDLITTLQSALQQVSHDQLQAAYDAMNAAVLAGDQATANAQAAIISNLENAAETANLKAEIKFKLDVIAVLKTNGDQAGLLRTKFGDSGFLRILDSLAGHGPGRGGRF